MELEIQDSLPTEVTDLPRAVTVNHPSAVMPVITAFPHSIVENVAYPTDIFKRWGPISSFNYSTSDAVGTRIFDLNITVDWVLNIMRAQATLSGFPFADNYLAFTGKVEIEFFFTPSCMYAGKLFMVKTVEPFGWKDLTPGGARTYACSLPGISLTPQSGETVKFEIDCTTLYGGIPTKLGNWSGAIVGAPPNAVPTYYAHPLRDYHFCRIQAFTVNFLRTVSAQTTLPIWWRYRFSEIAFSNMSPSFAKVPPIPSVVS